MAAKKLICRICGSTLNKIIYDGPIRSGGVGSGAVSGYRIHKCCACGFVFIDPIPEKLDKFYETEEYRLKFDYQTDVPSLQKKYDSEQNARISRIGVEVLRNKTVADFGAGAGLFLDTVLGIAKNTIAVEPSRQYQKYLASRGHACYGYAKGLIKADKKIDIAVSFDTVEHVFNVKEFTGQIYDSLSNDGIFYLSMPNHNDMVRHICPLAFEPFFYQVSHLNYFDKDSAALLLKNAGFVDIKIGYLHKYTIANILQWAKNSKPGILDTGALFDIHFNNAYRTEIERLGIASHLFITAYKSSHKSKGGKQR